MVNIIDETSPFAQGLVGAFQGTLAGQQENRAAAQEQRRQQAFDVDLESAKMHLARDAELVQQQNQDRIQRNLAIQAQQDYQAKLRPLDLEQAQQQLMAGREKLNMQSMMDEQTAQALADKPEEMKAQFQGFQSLIAGLGPLDEDAQKAADIALGTVGRMTTPETQAKAIQALYPGLQKMQEQRVRGFLADKMDQALREGHFEEDPDIHEALGPMAAATRAGAGDVSTIAQGFAKLQAQHAQHLLESRRRDQLTASIDQQLATPDPFEPHSPQYVQEMDGLRAALQAGMSVKDAQAERLKIQMNELERKKGASSYEFTPGKAYQTAHGMALGELEKGLIQPKDFDAKVREHMQQLMPQAQMQSNALPFQGGEPAPMPDLSGAPPTKPKDIEDALVKIALTGADPAQSGIDPAKVTPMMKKRVLERVKAEKQSRSRAGSAP